MESRKYNEEPQITAQPKSPSDALLAGPVPEPGLSVEPEELGRHFLSEATEQSNFESSIRDAAEMSISDPPPTDDALVSPAWEEDRSLWQQTIERGLQSGGFEGAGFGSGMSEAPIEGREQTRAADLEEEDDNEDTGVVASTIREVSLFDHEGTRPGEIEETRVEADEQAVQARHSEAARNDNRSAARRAASRQQDPGHHHSRRTVNGGRR